MDAWEAALLIGAIVTATVSYKDRRALMWIAIGAGNFAITTTWARVGNPPPPTAFVTGCFDAFTALAIITFGRAKWERALGYVFQFMVLVSIGRVAGLLPDRYLYVVILELANWAALFLIGGTHVAALADEWMGRSDVGNSARRAVHRFASLAFQTRRRFPFWSPYRK
jgi:uncharacterized membrane protein YoaK (UPF0700 family)